MTNKFEKTEHFNRTFGNAVRDTPDLGGSDIPMRMNIFLEEAKEVEEAYIKFQFLDEIEEVLVESNVPEDYYDRIMTRLRRRVNVEFLDGLVDTQVVLDGLAQGTGMPVNEAFDAVYESNMSKLNPDGTVLRRADGKTLKGENYFSPTDKLNEILGYK